MLLVMAGTSIASAAARTPADTGAPYRILAAQEARIARIAGRLIRSNDAQCPADQRSPSPGWLLSDTRLVPAAARGAARAAYGIASDAPDGVHVAALMPGGAAEAAGVRVGDMLLDPRTLDAVEASWHDGTGASAPMVRFHRSDAPLLRPAWSPSHCTMTIRLEASDAFKAWATPQRLHLSSGIVTLAADDAALAFVLAHEWAHVRLGHPLPGSAGWSRGLRAREAAADAAAVEQVDAAGWDARAVPGFFAAFGKALGPRFGWSHGSPRSRSAAVVARIAALCARKSDLSPARPSCTTKAVP